MEYMNKSFNVHMGGSDNWDRIDWKKGRAIESFRGPYHFLSNFSRSSILVDSKWYDTVEHAFQAYKTNDLLAREHIRQAATPGEAKQLGQICPLRPDWDTAKIDVMRTMLRKKFRRQKNGAKLLATGSANLVEGNTWHDNYWGDCRCARCKDKPGENHLGKLLMEIRNEIRQS
jgi:ribA/ribD-fused uncharacterized protein